MFIVRIAIFLFIYSDLKIVIPQNVLSHAKPCLYYLRLHELPLYLKYVANYLFSFLVFAEVQRRKMYITLCTCNVNLYYSLIRVFRLLVKMGNKLGQNLSVHKSWWLNRIYLDTFLTINNLLCSWMQNWYQNRGEQGFRKGFTSKFCCFPSGVI